MYKRWDVEWYFTVWSFYAHWNLWSVGIQWYYMNCTEQGAKSMSDIHPKKLVILYILDILQKYTDEEHRLSQKEIQDILKREYEMTVDRKAVKRNLLNLKAILNIEKYHGKIFSEKKILYHIKAPRILRIKKSRKTICYGRIFTWSRNSRMKNCAY